MIASLSGRPVAVDSETVVLDVNGVGYQVRATTGVIQRAATAGDQLVTVQTWMYVRDDALQLFGFASPAERTAFERLITLQGVGPRVALSIVSSFGPQEIRRAAEQGDVALFQSVPGIGPKVARRIVTELRDKVSDLGAEVTLAASAAPDEYYDAREALVGLGLSLQEADGALRQVDEALPAEDRVREALRLVRA